ncbi:MAG TPA: glycosyltransferase [Acidimicrobiales bacterium]
MTGAGSVALVGAGLAAGALLLARVPRPGRAGAAPPGVRASIVVPARDEAATLPTLLASLRDLEPPAAEVIVVDDGSRDGTARVAAAHGARVVPASPPAGWAGKPWACHVGAQAARGSLLVFLDADTRLAPGALGRLLAEQAAHGGLVSVQPHHEAVRAHEQLSAFFSVVAMMGTGAFAPGRRGRARMAFGPCLVTAAEDYRAVGGHAAVRGEVVEDVHLARRYAAHGLPVRCLAGGNDVRFRMYPTGPSQLVEGWTKNIAAGAGLAPPWAAAGTAAWVASCAAVATAGVRGGVAWATGTGPPPAVAAAAWLVVAGELWWMLRRVGSWRPWAALAFPVPLAVFVGVFARSAALALLGREVTWRSRRVPAGAGRRR